MLSKKLAVQKSFRIEANMEADLELLSQKLNRPQNELVNSALNQLMLDNMGWFVEDYFVELCEDFLDKRVSEIDISITGFKIHIYDDGANLMFSYDIELPDFKEHCKGSPFRNDDIGYAALKRELKEIALKIGIDSPEIQEYLQNRFGYIFARESIIQKFSRDKFIRQYMGSEAEDALYKSLIQLDLTEEQQKKLQDSFKK